MSNHLRVMIDRELTEADRLTVAQQQAAEIRARNFPAPCQCDTCQRETLLPAVLRIVEQASRRAA